MHSLGFSQKLHYGAVSACCVKPAPGRNRDFATANKPPVREAVKHIQLKVSVPEYMGLPQEPQAEAAADSADMYVTPPYFIDDLVHGKASQHGAKTLVPLYATLSLHIVSVYFTFNSTFSDSMYWLIYDIFFLNLTNVY